MPQELHLLLRLKNVVRRRKFRHPSPRCAVRAVDVDERTIDRDRDVLDPLKAAPRPLAEPVELAIVGVACQLTRCRRPETT